MLVTDKIEDIAKYLELDSIYTDIEYERLSLKLSENLHTFPALESYINCYIGILRCLDVYKMSEFCLSFLIFKRSKEVFDILYQTPIEELPLYINGTSVEAIIAVWRMGVRK